MKVFVKISNWHKGVEFEESVEVMVFDTLEKAIKEMKMEQKQVEDTFKEVYGKNNFLVKEDMAFNSIDIYDIYHGVNDRWSCEIVEKDIL